MYYAVKIMEMMGTATNEQIRIIYHFVNGMLGSDGKQQETVTDEQGNDDVRQLILKERFCIRAYIDQIENPKMLCTLRTMARRMSIREEARNERR